MPGWPLATSPVSDVQHEHLVARRAEGWSRSGHPAQPCLTVYLEGLSGRSQLERFRELVLRDLLVRLSRLPVAGQVLDLLAFEHQPLVRPVPGKEPVRVHESFDVELA